VKGNIGRTLLGRKMLRAWFSLSEATTQNCPTDDKRCQPPRELDPERKRKAFKTASTRR